MDDEILQRIGRIYAAIRAIEENDPQKLKATFIQTNKIKVMFQDFRGGLGDDDLSNQAYSVIYNIANLRDHLRRWARDHNQDEAKVDEAVKKCPELQIIRELSNNDKHGPPTRGGHSAKYPQLLRITRVMRLQTHAKRGSTIAMKISAGGIPIFLGDGTAKAVVTGDVLDNHGKTIGDLYEIAGKAVEAWECLLVDYGLLTATKGT